MGQGSVAEVLDVNLYGIRRVCDKFAPLIESGGRIVNVTSAAAPNFVASCSPDRQSFFCNGGISWEELAAFIVRCGELEPTSLTALGLGSDSAYGFSKACANSFTLWLAKQYPALCVNACTPGFIETDLGKQFLGSRSPAEAGMKSPAAGAQVIIKLLFGEARGSGHYYGSDALRSPMHRYRAPGSPEFTD
jgi:NAD(P)-dependent dehydrogenase (short-subunit alcohol dehydrogenase family)